MKTLFDYQICGIKSILRFSAQIYYHSAQIKNMSEDEQLDYLITQTLDGALQTIPAYMQEIEQNRAELGVVNVKEFVYGVVMGMALGMASTAVAALRQGMPTEQDQQKIRDLIYSKVPQVRERIFS
jgi:hypothetical protein